MLKLLEPTKENLQKMKVGLQEIKAKPTSYDIGSVEKLIDFMDKDFDGYMEYWQKRQFAENLPTDRVPSTTLFLFDDDKFVGVYDIRHYLNDFLKTQGGHVAGEIIPSERGKGYGREGLKLVLKWCHDNLKIDQVMVSCNAQNLASHRQLTAVLNEMGGKRDPDIKLDNHIEHRLWINTAQR